MHRLSQRTPNEVLAESCFAANRVAGPLWMGSMPIPYSRLNQHFDGLVLCACEYQCPPGFFPGVEVLSVSLNDDGSPMTKGEAFAAVGATKKVLSWITSGMRVLVTCMQGRNRSGLVTALSLCHGPWKMSPQQAVAAIRTARGPAALSNPDFVQLIHGLGRGTPT